MEEIVVLNEQGEAVAVMPEESGHNLNTPLHLGFSCYVFNPAGEFLLTRRGWLKRTWPGIWTNSCCGHPAPGEAIDDAARRRLSQELGLNAVSVHLVIADYRFSARMATGIVENEVCPIFRVLVDREPVPDSIGVAETKWVPWTGFLNAVRSMRVTPWCHTQAARLARLGSDPFAWPDADHRVLPPAAHLAAAQVVTSTPSAQEMRRDGAQPDGEASVHD